jgi:hypothetical protein
MLMCAFATMVAAAGCGGDSGNGTTTASIDKAEFVKRANAICTEGQEKLQTGFEALTHEQSASSSVAAKEEEWVNRVVAPSISQEVGELRALGTPRHDGGRVEALLAAVEDGLQKLKADPKSVLATSAKKFAVAIGRAEAYGLDACAQNY